MFQGQARGKLGDVVFSHVNGEQITRVYNPNPANSRTNAQIYQRAVIATVMRAYAAAKEIFDHAFEGCSTPAENQQAFMHYNARLLRANLAKDINNGTAPENCLARFCMPRIDVPVSNPYLLSKGSLRQEFFTVDNGAAIPPLKSSANQTVAEYAAANRLVADELYSFVIFAYNETVYEVEPDDGDAFKGLRRTFFQYFQLKVKSDLAANNDVLTDCSQLFDVNLKSSDNQVNDLSYYEIGTNYRRPFSVEEVIGHEGGAIGVIRSKVNEKLRSTSYMQINSTTQEGCGIVSPYVLDVWRKKVVTIPDE